MRALKSENKSTCRENIFNFFWVVLDKLETKRLEHKKWQHENVTWSLWMESEAKAEIESAQEDDVARIKKLQEKESSDET